MQQLIYGILEAGNGSVFILINLIFRSKYNNKLKMGQFQKKNI